MTAGLKHESGAMHTIPIIDLTEFRQGDKKQALSELDSACREHGFFLLINHGLEQLIDEVWQQTEAFFAAPQDVKRSVIRNRDNPMGYYDRELTKQLRDLKEVFDFKAGGHMPSRPEMQQPWPAEMPAFRSIMEAYFNACSGLAHETLDLVYQIGRAHV